MVYQSQNFERLLGTVGMSDQLLKNHFTLYEGYVKNTNTLLEKLSLLRAGKQFGTQEYTELLRRYGWEWNGMRLHELYFGNLTKGGSTHEVAPQSVKAIAQQWGSYEAWEEEFKEIGKMRGIGWVVLSYDRESKMLVNQWINEHDVGHLAGAEVLVVMDVFEHAFMLDYGLKRVDYIAAFWTALDWSVIEARYQKAASIV